MKRYQRAAARNPHGLYIRKQVARNRRRAIWVGLLYLLAIFAFAAAVCVLPLFEHELAPIGITEFYNVFLPNTLKSFDASDKAQLVALMTCAIFALLLFTLAINALKALSKLSWLCKKRGSKVYGFNRNVYAMEELGNIFSGSFTVIVNFFLIMSLCCGEFAITQWMYILLGAGVALRVLLGFWGSKTGYYDLVNGNVVEEKRTVGRFAPVVRNILQFAAIIGILCFLNFADLHERLFALLTKDGLKEFLSDINVIIPLVAEVLVVLCLFVLVRHATNITEYNFDGPYGAGMKNFKLFSFFIFLFAGGAVVYQYSMMEQMLDKALLIIAGIALAMFIVELIMIGMPYAPEEKKAKTVDGEEEISIKDLPLRPEQ